MIHKIIAMPEKNYDGGTTRNAVPIIKRMNVYLQESRYLAIKMYVIAEVFREIRNGSYQDSDTGCGIFRTYAENIPSALANRAVKNCAGIGKSISAQRRLFKMVKDLIKVNKINRDWEDLLKSQLDYVEERMDYVTRVTLVENMRGTPIEIFVKYLEKSGKTLNEDIESFIENNPGLYDDINADPAVIDYKKHIESVLDRNSNEKDLHELIQEGLYQLEQKAKRDGRLTRQREEEERKEHARLSEETDAMVLQICSQTESLMRKERDGALLRHARKYPELFVVVAGIIPKDKTCRMRVGYLVKYSFSITTQAANASLFTSENDAKEYEQKLKEKRNNIITAIARIDLSESIYKTIEASA